MKRLNKYLKRKKAPKKLLFLNKCPVTGGICLNPMCLMGCIEE